MNRSKPQSLLLKKYEKAYRENSLSRVFAPLAECYRKLGMREKAIEVLKKGIKKHPDYVLAYQCLATCYFEQSEYTKAYGAIEKFILKNRDNIRLQKIFAEICRKLGKLNEALETYKFLLFINPKDEEVAGFVAALEGKEITPAIEPLVDLDKKEHQANVDDWSQVSFIESEKKVPLTFEKVETPDDWTMTDNLAPKPSEKDREFHIHKSDSNGGLTYEANNQSPAMSLTLVELYQEQGYIHKAKEVLDKLLELNPDSNEIKAKTIELREFLKNESTKVSKPMIEENGYTDLMTLFDEKVGAEFQETPNQRVLEKRLYHFLERLKVKAKDFKTL